MSARDDYRALASWSGAPFGVAVMEARRALDEIDQLRADVETMRTAYQRDLQGLRDERDALVARRDEVMRLSGKEMQRVSEVCDSGALSPYDMSDQDLPGMWERADFTGGEFDR